jgi:hypothetical protein
LAWPPRLEATGFGLAFKGFYGAVEFTWSPLLLDSGCAAATSWSRIFLNFIPLKILKLIPHQQTVAIAEGFTGFYTFYHRSNHTWCQNHPYIGKTLMVANGNLFSKSSKSVKTRQAWS